MKKQLQKEQLEQFRPAQLDHGDGAWRAVRTMRVRLYVDPALAKKTGVRGDFADTLERASRVLESALRIRLRLEDMRELPSDMPLAYTDGLLAALQQLDAGEDVDFVIAMTSASPVATMSFHDIGRASVLGKHIVLRTMDDAGELRALATYDAIDPNERSRLYAQRKRHKQTAVLLHEIGHTLGALHTRDALDLMHPSYDNRMQQFAQPDIDLMQLVVDARLGDAAQQDSAALVQRLKDYLEHSDWHGFVEEERQSYLAALENAARAPSAGAAGAGSAQAEASGTPVTQPQPQPQDDLSALSEADRARYRGIDAAWNEQRWADAFAIATELARSYPDTYTVQERACKLGLQLSVAYREVRPYCDRMAKLAMHAAGPAPTPAAQPAR